MRMLEYFCMLVPKALKLRAIKDTVALFAHSTGATTVQDVHMGKCLGTFSIPILPCSIDKDWAPTRKRTMDLSFVTEGGNS